MSKAILIYRLVKFECAIAFQILAQGSHLIEACGAIFEVRISACPEFATEYVFLRGVAADRDLELLIRKFSTNAARDDYFDRLQEALIAFGHKNNAPNFIDAGDHIYILARA